MKISIYFLFYVAMILELLIFIVDRDTAEEIVDKSAVSMIEQMSSVDRVKMFGALGFKMGGIDSTVLEYYPFKLISNSERDGVRFEVKRSYHDKSGTPLMTVTDMTNLDGSTSVKTDTVHVVDAGVPKLTYVRYEFARDSTTGDLRVRVLHTCPLGPNGRINYQKAYLFGMVELQVKAILQRQFPEAVLANTGLVQQLEKKYRIQADNFYPPCDSAVTRIEFKPTENVVVGW
jgi:hypothetical protein